MQPLEELRGRRKQHAEEHGSCDRNKQRCREVEGIEHYEDASPTWTKTRVHRPRADDQAPVQPVAEIRFGLALVPRPPMRA